VRVAALLAVAMSVAVAAHSSAPSQPQPVATLDLSQLLPPGPVTNQWTKNIAFVSDSSVAVGLCEFEDSHAYDHAYFPVKRDCSLTLIRWEGRVLQPLAQTHQFSPSESIHLTAESRILTTSFGKAPAILYSSDLSMAAELPPLHYASQSGNTVAELTQGGWKLYHLDSKLHPIRGGPGNLQSISDEVAVFQIGDMIQTETLDGKLLGSFRVRPMCYAQLAGRGRLFLSNCKRPRFVDFNGTEWLGFRPTKEWGLPQLSWSADGKRALFDHFNRRVSVLRSTGEILVAFASLGMGVGDEQDNHEQVEVMDIATGNFCFDLRRGFAENAESPSQNAVISPSGEFVAMAVGGTLFVYHLPAACEAKK